jgi:DNA-binding transcriptional regulator LsrR (DeoR family)
MMQEPMSPKEKRMSKAARLRYMQNMDNHSIADELGLAEKTIRNYFSSSEMEQFKRFYSDQELFQLQQAIENDLRDAEAIAKEALGEAKRQAEDSSDYRQVAEAALKIRQRKISMLQELGVIDKEPDKVVEKDKGSGDEVVERMQQAYQEMQEQEKVEAEN